LFLRRIPFPFKSSDARQLKNKVKKKGRQSGLDLRIPCTLYSLIAEI
jgi:hypothetical protein